jgi:hypothetical protein
MTIDPNARRHDSEESGREDVDFALRLAAALRKPESPRAGFAERVTAAVSEISETRIIAGGRILPQDRRLPAKWRRPRTIALPLVAWGALAAGFAAIVSLGTLAVARTAGSNPQQQIASVSHAPASPAPTTVSVQPSHDTIYVVRFVLADAGARTVTLVGDFNAWAKQATPLRMAKPGVWSAQVALGPGRHEYAFVVDGKRWVADPAAERLADDFDTPSSVVTVGRAALD